MEIVQRAGTVVNIHTTEERNGNKNGRDWKIPAFSVVQLLKTTRLANGQKVMTLDDVETPIEMHELNKSYMDGRMCFEGEMRPGPDGKTLRFTYLQLADYGNVTKAEIDSRPKPPPAKPPHPTAQALPA